MPAPAVPTQVEKDKLDIDPDFDFREIANRPFEDLTPNEIGMFKWAGVYHQLQTGNFMIRLRIPGGLMTSCQLKRAADLVDAYGQGLLCITTRQCLQYHWVQQCDIHKIIEGMHAVGVLTKNACGDVCRNVISCSLQGVCPHEEADTNKMVESIADDPVMRDQQRNLPRKHKISVSGCGASCGQALMNCQGWYPVVRSTSDGNTEQGWALTSGGGLGGLPHMGKQIFAWVPEDLVVEVARAIVEIHNRRGNRRKRKYARLKIVVAEMGVDAFRDLVFTILRENDAKGLERMEAANSEIPDLKQFPFEGQPVIPQKQRGLNTVRIMIPRSEITGAQTRAIADWAEAHGDGQIMLTNRQNIEIRNVPDESVDTLSASIAAAGYRASGHEHLPDIVSCVGTTMCNLAVSDTPRAYRLLTEAFADEEALWKEVGPLRINMNGCPNACGQHWIADIGLRGRRTRGETGSEEGFSIYVGGRLDAAGHVGELAMEVAATDTASAIRAMLSVYLQNRNSRDERFGNYTRRIGGEAFGALTAAAFQAEKHEPANLRNQRLQAVLDQAFQEARS